MISVVVIEDDFISSDLLISQLNEMDEEIDIKAVLRSVRDGIEFFRMHQEVDLILSDIQLSDGLSFQIFEEVSLRSPVIFVSAYDQYLINAFEYGGIDYLLKPVSKEGIVHAITKYKSLQKHFLEKNVFIRKFAAGSPRRRPSGSVPRPGARRPACGAGSSRGCPRPGR